jgi:hypothetical protein
MHDLRQIAIIQCAFAVLAQGFLLTGCDAPAELDDQGPWSWSGKTSDEYPPLSCPSGGAVHGIECEGSFCDNIELDCMSTGRAAGENTWLPYFSEEGTGSADEGRCKGDDTWMTGIACRGPFCDNITVECSQILGSSTGTCEWSKWYSEEQPAFHSPGDSSYIKGIECDGSFCDRMRYRHCEML